MAIKIKAPKELLYREAARYLAKAALEHKGQVPLVAGLYGGYSQEKIRFPHAVDNSLVEKRGSRLIHVLGQINATASGIRMEYERFRHGVAHTFPLIILSDNDMSCSHADVLSLEAFKKFPEFIVLIEDMSAPSMGAPAFLRALELRTFYAQYFEVPFAYPEFILIRLG